MASHESRLLGWRQGSLGASLLRLGAILDGVLAVAFTLSFNQT
jgi:hypothetical protein